MQLRATLFTVRKRFPLRIARGTTAATTNLWVTLVSDGIEGWGEGSPFSVVREAKDDSNYLKAQVEAIAPQLADLHPLQRQEIGQILLRERVSSSVRAAIEVALYDWLGKKVGLPLWQLWGLHKEAIVPISVTVGIGTPQAARERVRAWQEITPIQRVKVKLGNPEGIEADKAMLAAVREMAPQARGSVDANGGWTLETAVEMSQWLAQQGVDYIEQPLPVGQESLLETLSQRSPLPIFVDESCFTRYDIPKLAPGVGGINIKLMKAGGVGEVMAMVQTARACGLQVMYGCYSDSTLANTAMAHLSPLADYLDLDSHLNLRDDPFTGAVLQKGCLLPQNLPGLGVNYRGLEC